MSDTTTLKNKSYPDNIAKEVELALAHYPALSDTPITFRFKKKIKKSFMQAQPKFFGIFKNKKKRAYLIFISESFQIEGESFEISDIPSDVLVGWIGHELGHIMDYRERSGWNMLIFGVRYLLSSRFITEAERMADTYAVNHGMGNYILATKNFILDHATISEAYKTRIKRLYLSPEEIMLLVEKLDEAD